MSAPRGLFVTGTDTGVGKTLVAAGLLRLARRRGLVPIPFKPAETGCDPEPADARRLWRAATPPLSPDEVCMHALPLPAAPALAASSAGVAIDLVAVADRAYALAQRGDFLVVEGAGGLLVPYSGAATAADLAARIGLPLLIVGRTALGTINHTALTLAEATRRRLSIAGYILNRTFADTGPHEDGNGALIADVTGRRPLGTLPFLPPEIREDDDRVADALLEALGEDVLRLLLGPPARV
jgi:dethiobiotin synthetase